MSLTAMQVNQCAQGLEAGIWDLEKHPRGELQLTMWRCPDGVGRRTCVVGNAFQGIPNYQRCRTLVLSHKQHVETPLYPPCTHILRLTSRDRERLARNTTHTHASRGQKMIPLCPWLLAPLHNWYHQESCCPSRCTTFTCAHQGKYKCFTNLGKTPLVTTYRGSDKMISDIQGQGH